MPKRQNFKKLRKEKKTIESERKRERDRVILERRSVYEKEREGLWKKWEAYQREHKREKELS